MRRLFGGRPRGRLVIVERLILLVALVFAGCATTGETYKRRGIEYHAPSFSPDSRQIMVGAIDYDVGQQYLELMDPDGGNLTRISPIPRASQPGEWSKDGKLLVFTAYRHHQTELSIMRTRDQEIYPLRPAKPIRGRSVRWVPNTSEISYFVCTQASFKDCTAGDIMAIGTEGEEPRVAVPDAGPGAGTFVLWSPDGRWIAYQRYSESLDCSPPQCAVAPIYIRSAQDGKERKFANGVPITWIPDSHHLLFIAGKSSRLERIAADEDGKTELFFEGNLILPTSDQRRLWDRPGRRVALATREGIVVLDRTGRLIADFREKCTSTTAWGCNEYDGNLAWTPDGGGILYVRREPYNAQGGREGGIYLLNIQTGRSSLLVADTMKWGP